MRYTVIKGIDTDFRANIERREDIIAEVIEISTRGGELTYELDMSGEELEKFLSRFEITLDGIARDKKYTVTSYDW